MHRNLKYNVKPILNSDVVNNHPPWPTYYHRVGRSSTSKRARFTDKQRKFIADKFQQGESSGRKIDPASVARSMLIAVDARGNRILISEDFLTASKIAGFFSRLASKKTLSREEYHEEALVGASQDARVDKCRRSGTYASSPWHVGWAQFV